MTLLQSLGLKLAMLAVTIATLYWALNTEVPQPNITVSERASPSVKPIVHEESTVAPAGVPAIEPAPVSSETSRDHGRVTGKPAKSSVTKVPARQRITFPLDLNKADRNAFMELPGIGEKIADRILEYRKAHGGFRNVEELRQVKGIGKKRMERLRPLVTTTSKHD